MARRKILRFTPKIIRSRRHASDYKHDQVVQDLEFFLKKQDNNYKIRKFLHYNVGEIDLLQIKHTTQGSDYKVYEVKSSDSHRGRKHAKDQLRKAYHYLKGKPYFLCASFYYVNPHGIEQIR